MRIKTTLFAGALALSLVPLAANAAPHGGGMMMMSGNHDAFHDHSHRPPMRVEHRPPMPHGHYRWHDGAWGWQNNAWVWAPGIWVRF
jgi:hypothetical protein